MKQVALALLLLFPLACSSEPEKKDPPPALTEVEGIILVKGTKDAPVCMIQLADSSTYQVTGKLEKMLRGMYKGKSVKIAGNVREAPSGSKPGLFEVREIVVILNQ